MSFSILCPLRIIGSIPKYLWWSATTVYASGYGDTIPITAIGKIIEPATSLLGIGANAIPTGILAAGFSESIGMTKKNVKSSIQIDP